MERKALLAGAAGAGQAGPWRGAECPATAWPSRTSARCRCASATRPAPCAAWGAARGTGASAQCAAEWRSPGPIRPLGAQLLACGEHLHARQLYEKALQTFPCSRGCADGLAAVLDAQGEYQCAQQVLKMRVRLSPWPFVGSPAGQAGPCATRIPPALPRPSRSAVEQGKNSRQEPGRTTWD